MVMEYSPEGNTLAAGLFLGGTVLFDVDQPSGVLKFRARSEGGTKPVDALAFSPDGAAVNGFYLVCRPT